MRIFEYSGEKRIESGGYTFRLKDVIRMLRNKGISLEKDADIEMQNSEELLIISGSKRDKISEGLMEEFLKYGVESSLIDYVDKSEDIRKYGYEDLKPVVELSEGRLTRPSKNKADSFVNGLEEYSNQICGMATAIQTRRLQRLVIHLEKVVSKLAEKQGVSVDRGELDSRLEGYERDLDVLGHELYKVRDILEGGL